MPNKQKNFRLDSDIVAELEALGPEAQFQTTADLIRLAIEREPEASRPRRTQLKRTDPQAYEFMMSAPTPMVIKDDKAEILWANRGYQRLVHHSLDSLCGKSLAALNLLEWEGPTIEADI